MSVNEFDNLYFVRVSLEVLYLSTFVLSKSVLTYLSTYLNIQVCVVALKNYTFNRVLYVLDVRSLIGDRTVRLIEVFQKS